MSTRSSVRNLFPPLDNPELTIRRRSHTDPTLLNDFEMDIEGNGDLPVPDLQTMEELCQPSLNATVGQTHNAYAARAYQGNSYQPKESELSEPKQESRKLSSSGEQPRKEPILPRS
nr:hypothetical protein [Tanacetum cinerariifolium]